MAAKTVGIRELKTQFSRYMQQVKTGATPVITEHDKPIGRIVPVQQSLDEKINQLREAGFLEWSGKKLVPRLPTARTRGKKTVAELLLEDRD